MRHAYINNNEPSPRLAIDLFAGCGGLTYGLKQAKFKVVAALELDVVAAATYQFNHPETLLKRADIRTVDGKLWMKELKVRPGDIDLLAGCPPCQGFSTLRTNNGARSNKDRRNRLILEMARLILDIQPKAIMMENVPGLESKRVFQDFLSCLRKRGYESRWQVLDVRRYGVPQRRKRLILVAGRDFEIPFGSELKYEKTVRNAIGNLKRSGGSGDFLHDMPETRSKAVKERIARIPKNGGSRTDLPENTQLLCHQKLDGFKDVYGRMAWDDVAPTITGGCFNPSKGRFLHPEEDRNITMREAALLQTFPRSFRVPIGTTKTDVARMLGNALPPKFVRSHASAIRKSIEKEFAG